MLQLQGRRCPARCRQLVLECTLHADSIVDTSARLRRLFLLVVDQGRRAVDVRLVWRVVLLIGMIVVVVAISRLVLVVMDFWESLECTGRVVPLQSCTGAPAQW